MKRLHVLGAAAAAALVIFGTSTLFDSGAMAEEKSSVGRASAVSNDDDLAALQEADLAFALDAFRASSDSNDNAAFSPYSLSQALSLVRAGANGTTRSQIDTAMHTSSVPDWDSARNTVALKIAEQKGRKLSVANALFAQKGMSLEGTYLDTLAADYGAGVYPVDFEHNTASAVSAFNRFVNDNTNGMIKKATIQPDAGTRALIVNASYLNAAWQDPFKADDTQRLSFTTADGSDVSADLMSRDGHALEYTNADNYELAKVPYKHGLSMLLIVPKNGQFASVRSSLTAPALLQAEASMSSGRLNRFKMPKFEATNDISLLKSLRNLGITDAFTDNADFSRMTSNHLSISDVEQQVVVKVDEKGTKAAAVTKMKFNTVGAPISDDAPIDLIIDRPYLYMVMDDETGAIFFMGQETNPTATG